MHGFRLMPVFDLNLSNLNLQCFELELIFRIVIDVLNDLDLETQNSFFEHATLTLNLSNNELLKDSLLVILDENTQFLWNFKGVELNLERTGISSTALYHSLVPFIKNINIVSLNLSSLKLNFTFIKLFCEILPNLCLLQSLYFN